MSRVGKKPVAIPSGVKVVVSGQNVKVSGPKGELAWDHPSAITVKVDSDANQVEVARSGDDSRARALHGLTRSLISNMVEGVSKGFTKQLEIYGTGYGCQLKGKQLLLNCGFMGRGLDRSGKQKEAQFTIDVPDGVNVTIVTPAARGNNEPARMTLESADKQKVGQFAADIRKLRPPEPYLGKGIRYADEQVQRKQGKAFAGGG
jgi:large subunit ribosomal protein L6